MRRVALVALLVALGGPAAAAPVPVCPDQANGVNDHCERWARVFNEGPSGGATAVDAPAGMVPSHRGDRLYLLTTSRVGAAATHVTLAALKPGSGGATLWLSHPPTNLTTRATALTVTPDDRTVLVTGQVDYLPRLGANLETMWLTTAYAASTGHPLWSVQFMGSGADTPVAIAVSPKGDRVFVTGSSSYGNGSYVEWNTVGYAVKTGKQLWRHHYGGQAGGQNAPVGIAVAPGGNRVYVAGTSEHPQHTGQHAWDAAVVAYDARTGHPAWTSVTSSGSTQQPTALALAANGTALYLTGSAMYGTVQSPVLNAQTAAFDTRTGRLRWSVHHGGDATHTASPVAVATYGSRVYVTGAATANGAAPSAAIAVEALDASTGHDAWTATYAPAGTSASPGTLLVGKGGTRLYVAGVLLTGAAAVHPVVVAFTSAGQQAWVARYDLRDPGGAGTFVTGRLAPVATATDGRDVYVAIDDTPAAPQVDTQLCAAENAAGAGHDCATSGGRSALLLAYAG